MKIPKELVVKDNTLNQYTFYRSSIQLKIFAQIICDVRKEPDREIYTLEIKNVLEKFQGSKKNYEYLKGVCKNMMQVVEIPQEKGFNLSALFYNINTDEKGLINFEVNPKLKPYLLNISNNFTSYHLDKIANLKSGYTIRIYELLKQYQKGWWWKVTIEKLKEILQIEPNQYQKYSHFKNKIILGTQKELEAKTDIKFSFEEQKKGRRVEVITFYILPNKQAKVEEIIKENQIPKTTKEQPKEVIKRDTKQDTKKPTVEPIQEQKPLPKYTKNQSYEILSNKLHIDQTFITKIYEKYSEDKILSNALYTLKKFEKGSIKASIWWFLREALKNDYANQKSLFDIKEESKKAKAKQYQKEQKKLQKKKQKEEAIKKEFNAQIKQKVKDFITKNSDKMPKYYEGFKAKYSFVLAGEEDIQRAIEKKPMVESFFINYLAKKVLSSGELDFKKNINI